MHEYSLLQEYNCYKITAFILWFLNEHGRDLNPGPLDLNLTAVPFNQLATNDTSIGLPFKESLVLDL